MHRTTSLIFGPERAARRFGCQPPTQTGPRPHNPRQRRRRPSDLGCRTPTCWIQHPSGRRHGGRDIPARRVQHRAAYDQPADRGLAQCARPGADLRRLIGSGHPTENDAGQRRRAEDLGSPPRFIDPMTTLPSSAPSSSNSSITSGEPSTPSTSGCANAVTRRSSRLRRSAIAIGFPPLARAPRAGWSAATRNRVPRWDSRLAGRLRWA
jgi:hypothetical protein